MPALDQRLRVACTGGRIVAERLRGVAVHHRLAADDRLLSLLGGGEERLGGGAMHGGEDHRGGRAVLHQAVEERLRRRARVRGRGIAALFGEGEATQPVEQVLAGGGEHPVLREVDMGVDEAGKHEGAAVVVGRQAAEALREGVPRVRARRYGRSRPPLPRRDGGSGRRRAARRRPGSSWKVSTAPPNHPRPGVHVPPVSGHFGCAASQAPRRVRSPSVMPVVLPRGIVRVRTV